MSAVPSSTTSTTLRNSDLSNLANLLQSQQVRKLDFAVPSSAISSVSGNLVLSDTSAVMDESGVTPTVGTYSPTAVCDEHLADKLNIPTAYLKRLRSEHIALFDANVNGWLERDNRRHLLRLFRPDDGGVGIARAMLSDSYRAIDHLDAVTAIFEGLNQATASLPPDSLKVTGCDLTERTMRIRISVPSIRVLAPVLLGQYRNPFEDSPRRAEAYRRHGIAPDSDGRPVIFAGLEASNSEVGGGAFSICPRITALTCLNGNRITKDATRAIHLGSKLDEGIIAWSHETQKKSLELISLKMRDSVAAFLSEEYLGRVVQELEVLAGKPVTKPEETVKVVCSQLAFSKARTEEVLASFIRGGQLSAGGVANAITAVAQDVEDADEAAQLEGVVVRALELAAAAS